MRSRYFVAYDICDPKRLREVFKVMKGWGLHVQYSVFSCDLDETELIELRDELRAVIDFAEDEVAFANLGPVQGRGSSAITFLGKEDFLPQPPQAAIV